MASITVRNLDEGLNRRLRIRAAENGRSMEQEARDLLRAALRQGSGTVLECPPRRVQTAGRIGDEERPGRAAGPEHGCVSNIDESESAPPSGQQFIGAIGPSRLGF